MIEKFLDAFQKNFPESAKTAPAERLYRAEGKDKNDDPEEDDQDEDDLEDDDLDDGVDEESQEEKDNE